MTNLILPGNPRYQPKDLMPYFGYDNLFKWLAEVEIANLHVLADLGIMPPGDAAHLTAETQERLLGITTTEVDERERKKTKHDVRAWVELAQERVHPDLARWIHVPLTSYDSLDTGRILMYRSAHAAVVAPKLKRVIKDLAVMVRAHIETLQGGRTHGQPALPITVGFWMATLLSRLIACYHELERSYGGLVGKISGAVGASNAIVGLGFEAEAGDRSFEERVMERLDLQPARISTQILPPEPLAQYLHAVVLASAAFGQLGRDGRHLMRLEIAELAEPFTPGQAGSSTMAHKRNPVSFEGLEGQWLKTKSEYGKVLDTLISEHQRDLVGSTVMRDFPIMMINLVTQMNTLLRSDADGVSFLRQLRIDEAACMRNFSVTGHLVLGEPMYIALEMAGFAGAHEFVNHVLTPRAMQEHRPLIDIATELANDASEDYPDLADALARMPGELQNLLQMPDTYTGNASQKALDIAALADVI